MSFLRRLLGGRDEGAKATNGTEPADAADDPVDAVEAERLHERELLRSENERLDELRQRQLRYADKAWTPPKQGGERRADDEDRGAERS
jgi:hypothetical protein